MNKPVLVVMAAGMGSRYGGMKQIDPVGPNGEVIIDYSLYDAYRAGFRTVIFVIKHEIEEAFRAAIGDRISKIMEVKYAFQQLDILPTGFEVPENREKPWGTCHAVLAAKNLIDGPFAVINADRHRAHLFIVANNNDFLAHIQNRRSSYVGLAGLINNNDVIFRLGRINSIHYAGYRHNPCRNCRLTSRRAGAFFPVPLPILVTVIFQPLRIWRICGFRSIRYCKCSHACALASFSVSFRNLAA